ncbi:MAG: 2-amino-4-hydroxy-6-hydroxymethyldihydropteridine diphosphokinase [Desulfohalobiaceae bacterium]
MHRHTVQDTQEIPSVRAYIGLGSNVGQKEENLSAAVRMIVKLQGITYQKASRIYQTEPLLDTDQPWFANQVIEVSCDRSWTPERLLEELQEIEERLGRIRNGRRYGPRVIDCDLLLFGDVELQSETLTLPHPGIRSRAFVLVPLAEIAPRVRVAPGRSASQALTELTCIVKGRRIWQNPHITSSRT